MPQSTLYWIIGIIIVVLVILIIATAVRSSRRREEAAVEAAPRAAAQPAATTAAATQGGAVGAVADRDRTDSDADADARRAADAQAREETAVTGAGAFDAKTAEKKSAEKKSGSTAAPRPAESEDTRDAEARPASALSTFDAAEVDRRASAGDTDRDGAADAAPLGLAAAGVAGGTGVTVDDAATGAALPEPLGASSDASAEADRRPRLGTPAPAEASAASDDADRTAVPGVAGGAGVAVDKAEEKAEDTAPELSEDEALSRPVAGLPGMPGRVEVTEDQRRSAEAEVESSATGRATASSDTPAETVPGTTPLTGQDALIEAPEHAHEAPEPIFETPAYIQDSTTGQDPTKDLPEGQVYGTTPLTGEDAVIEARADVAETAESTGSADRADRAEDTVRPAVSGTDHVAVPGVAGGDGVQVDAAPVEAVRPSANAPQDSVVPTGHGVEVGDRGEAVAGRPAPSKLEAVKATVVETAGTVGKTAGTAAAKAAPVVGSAARTVGKAAGTVASTLKDKLADAQGRRWGRK